MRLSTEAVTILGYEGATDRDTKEPMTYKDGQAVEFVNFRADEDANGMRPRRWLLDRSINGDRPGEGERVHLEAVIDLKYDARNGRDGAPFVITKEKLARVTGFVRPKAA